MQDTKYKMYISVVIGLKYYRYGVKHQPINQSINYKSLLMIFYYKDSLSCICFVSSSPELKGSLVSNSNLIVRTSS